MEPPPCDRHLHPRPLLSTPLLLLPLGVIPPLRRCAQKRERRRSGVDARELREEEARETTTGGSSLQRHAGAIKRASEAQHRCPISGESRGEEQKKDGAPGRPHASAPQGGDTQRRKDSPKRSESVGWGEEESGGHRIGNNKEWVLREEWNSFTALVQVSENNTFSCLGYLSAILKVHMYVSSAQSWSSCKLFHKSWLL